jgi:hypothetical protein
MTNIYQPNTRTRVNLKNRLKIEEVKLEFTKKNGDLRKMRCTLNESFIPHDKLPKKIPKRKEPETALAVFDLDKQDWRSFCWDELDWNSIK